MLASELKNKELENKLKMLYSEKEEDGVEMEKAKQELSLLQNKLKDHNSALSYVQ